MTWITEHYCGLQAHFLDGYVRSEPLAEWLRKSSADLPQIRQLEAPEDIRLLTLFRSGAERPRRGRAIARELQRDNATGRVACLMVAVSSETLRDSIEAALRQVAFEPAAGPPGNAAPLYRADVEMMLRHTLQIYAAPVASSCSVLYEAGLEVSAILGRTSL